MTIYSKRIYDAVSETDGKRILVDRLWPRGIKKEDAKIDLWPKDVTPSNQLRKWYHEDIESRWDEFQKRYRVELSQVTVSLDELRKLTAQGPITLLTATKNQGRNHVSVLLDVLNPKA
ncbi:DUF488 domain-containing protein [Acinetobacter sp. AS167]|jgi:uncharacterized protein YeaO (DUF488 family)|uniref:DUF488 domain-containing protein n=1 Tax=Acinetobacter sp. AS167 TaxID=3127884 RepID=UPI00301724EB